MSIYFKKYAKIKQHGFPFDTFQKRSPRGFPLKPHHVIGKTFRLRHKVRRTNTEFYLAIKDFGHNQQILELILRNLPKAANRYINCLYRFAVSFKRGFPGGEGDWKLALVTWFFLAQPVNSFYRWRFVLKKFEQFYGNATRQPVTEHLNQIAGSAYSPDRSRVENCKEILKALSKRLGTTPFISCRLMGEWLKVSHTTAAKLLKKLVAAGTIKVVNKGRPHIWERQATTYDLNPLLEASKRKIPTIKVNEVFASPVKLASIPKTSREGLSPQEYVLACVNSLANALKNSPSRHLCPRCYQTGCDCFTEQ